MNILNFFIGFLTMFFLIYCSVLAVYRIAGWVVDKITQWGGWK